MDFDQNIQIYIASGEIYGCQNRLAPLCNTFPHIVKKDTILDADELKQFQNHSSQMAALDFMVSVASKRRYLGFKKTTRLDREKLINLIDLHQNGTISWIKFSGAVKMAHRKRLGRSGDRRIVANKPKEEDYFYANPQECFCDATTNSDS
ncbi:unnamed protein product [Lactuca saligna]|uniref:O-fucosyltransferase family protein n=1 Tax=Lactuca saligna TaxID=75948 RepID=A0AA35VQ66_LACSI|nr:unnamed protein product [Lactuca saligna]